MSSLGVDAVRNPLDADGTETGKLYAYRSGFGKVMIAASLMIPYGFVLFVVLFCTSHGGDYALKADVKITVGARAALIVHGLYFIMLPFGFELFIEILPLGVQLPGLGPSTFFGKMPARPDNLYWMMTCLTGECFFVAAVCFLLLAWQDEVPRWTLIVPMAQCAYNMKNDLLWVGFGPTFSPEGKRMTVMMIDWLLVGGCFVVYIHHFFGA